MVRKVWKVKYDAIFIFWLMTVFAFTFVNRIFFLDRMELINAAQMSSLAFLMPILSYFGYKKELVNFLDSEKYPAIFYGFTLIASAVVCVFNIDLIIKSVGEFNADGGLFGFNFFSIFLTQIVIAFIGLLITLQAKNY